MEAAQLRKDFEVFVKRAFNKNASHGTLRKVMVEDKSSGTGLIQEVRGRLPIPITPVPRQNDKLTRAMDVQAFHRDKRVVLPYGDNQNYELVAEVASFAHDDSHKHDDQTDVMIDALYVTLVDSGTEAPTLIVGY
jgi:predicted phage terminase large subunit-like protein